MKHTTVLVVTVDEEHHFMKGVLDYGVADNWLHLTLPNINVSYNLDGLSRIVWGYQMPPEELGEDEPQPTIH